MSELDEEYVLLVLVVALLVGIPPLRWLYRTYITLFIQAAQEQVELYKRQLSERLSDAGRKMSAKLSQRK